MLMLPNVAAAATSTAGEQLTHARISGLRFRELKRELQTRGLAEDGTTSQLRGRLRAAVFPDDVCVVREDGQEECGPYFGVSVVVPVGVSGASYSATTRLLIC